MIPALAPGPAATARIGGGDVTVKIPQELIDEIRAANDIVEVISERIPTKRAGASYKALCPFHQEKTPSFNISPERQIYHCFGCGVGGNVITFLMEYDKMGFLDAVAELARRAGISLPTRKSGPWEADDDPIYHANDVALRFFRRCLAGEGGREAREYWRRRGLSEETAELFQVGLAPAGWDGLIRAAEKEGISAAALADAGLVVRRDEGGFYDRFRNRLVFPLLVSGNRTVGFGGRSLGDQEPKYLNSPETPVYRKGHYLYGLAQVRPALRAAREAILVEGYMDLVSLYQAGFHHVVASAGTALSPDQARLIARYADKVFVAYDGDSAGIDAAIRAAETLVTLGIKVRVVALPDGSDPDSYVRDQGSDAMKERLAQALDFIEFLAAMRPGRTSGEREELARRLVDVVSRVVDPLKADLMLEKVAATLSMEKGALSRACGAKRAEGVRGARTAGRPRESGVAERPLPDAASAAERGILGILIAGGEAAERVRGLLAPDDIGDGALRSLTERILEETSPGARVDVAALLDRVGSPEEAALLTELSVLPPVDVDGVRLCDDYIRIVKRTRIEARVRAVDRAIETAEMLGNEGELLSLVAERQELARRLRELSVGGSSSDSKEARRGE